MFLAWRTGEAGEKLGSPHPALSTPLATLLRNAHYVRVIFLRRSLRSWDTQTPPKADLNSTASPALPAKILISCLSCSPCRESC